MGIEDFTGHHAVVHMIDELKAYWKKNKPKISDVYTGTDANRTSQYVDLVMEGGGVLGVALAGYTWTLEQVGVRFFSVGGTSAGSINALLLAGMDKPGSLRAERVLEKIADLEIIEFVDGGDDAEDFVRDLSKTGMIGNAQKIRSIMRNLDEVFGSLGMNRGDAFLEWLSGHLSDADVHTTADLHARMNDLPSGLKHPFDETPTASLRVVATDVTTSRKAVFPDEADLYFTNPENIDPALYVRASMAIPYFFEPLRVTLGNRSPDMVRLWREKADHRGRLPTEVLFVDGGILSNFPISLFHVPSVTKRPPSRPTFGVKLGLGESDPVAVRNPFEMAGAMFSTARRNSDMEFLRKNPDYKHLVGYIDTGDANWLNFMLRRDEKIELFRRGVKAACEFLYGFTALGWDNYKQIRGELNKVD